MGLREAKKQKTRKAISDLATKLFIERGYYNVTTAEIAHLAEVSVPTLFKYFPSKEALVFDEDSEMEEAVVDAVVSRKKGKLILDALLDFGLKELEMNEPHRKGARAFMKLIDETPELSLYARNMWLRHELALAKTIMTESKKKISLVEAEAMARFVLDALHRSFRTSEPKSTLKALFGLMKKDW